MPAATLVLDRQSGKVVEEPVFGGKELEFFYHTTSGRLLADRVVSTQLFNRLYGAWQRSRFSRRKIADFVAKLEIDAAEAAKPLSEYRSLDEFFTRALQPGARIIDSTPRTWYPRVMVA